MSRAHHVLRVHASRAAFLGLVLFVAFGCSHFSTERVAAARGTLGEEIVRVFCQRMASDVDPTDVTGLRWRPVCRGDQPPPSDAPERLVVLMRNRERLAGALDRVLPEDMNDELANMLGDILPLYDPPRERLPANTRLIADLLEQISEDDEAVAALARVGTRVGYRPLRLGLGLVRPVLAYDEFDSFATEALRVISDLPDDATDGLAASEWRSVQAALALELAGLEPAEPLAPGERSTLSFARELMFTHDMRFAGATASPRYVVIRDERGLALPAGGTVAMPFVDADRDGLADIDALGRFVDSTGGLLDVPSPFRSRDEGSIARDPGGRAIRGDATRYYEYVEADSSMLAGMLREAGPWFDPATPTAMDVARGIPAILGAETMLEETYGGTTLRYPAWDPADGGVYDLVYALGEIMPHEETDRALAMAEILFRDHEAEIAGLVDGIRYMANRSDMHPEAALRQPNSLWDDLIEMAQRFADQPGMIEALLLAFADPRSAQLGEIYGNLMRYRDAITYDPADPNGPPIGFPLDQRVDRTMADVQGNESLFQRSIALIDGLDGVRVCNRDGARLNIRLLGLDIRYPLIGTADACELIDIENVAEAYALAILGRYELEIQDGFLNFIIGVADTLGINVDDALEESSGIDGLTRRPTAQALNRLVFWAMDTNPATGRMNSEFAEQLFDRIDDRHGNDVIDTYRGTIFAWEQPGFYEGMTPLLSVLHDPRYVRDGTGRYNFGQMITNIYVHWPTTSHWYTQNDAPGSPNFSYQDDGRSYEELVADGFVEGRVLERMQQLNEALADIEVTPGRDGVRVMAEAAEALIDPDFVPDLATRDGRTSVRSNDGTHDMELSGVLLILDALRRIDRNWEMRGGDGRHEAWLAARHRLGEQFLGTRAFGDRREFANQRARAIVLAVLPFLRARLAEHRAAGDLVEWSRELTPDLADTLGSPLIAGLLQFLDRVQDDPMARDSLARLIGHLMSEPGSDDAFANLLYAGADMMMVLEDDTDIVPIAHALSAALATNAREVVAGSTEPLDTEGAVASDGLTLIREVQRLDTERTLSDILSNLVEVSSDEDEITPLETILDVIAEINRANPEAEEGQVYEVDDYGAMFGEVIGFMRDERRGLERLNLVVQNRQCFPEHGTPCTAGSAAIESAGLCRPGTCACVAGDGGAMRWSCEAN